MGAAFVETLPVGKFHGVGPVTADKRRLCLLWVRSCCYRTAILMTASPQSTDYFSS
jgi:hypothetical protein